MKLDKKTCESLDLAFQEARLLNVEFNESAREFKASWEICTTLENVDVIGLALKDVGRLAVSYRDNECYVDDQNIWQVSKSIPIQIKKNEILTTINQNSGCEIYSEHFNVGFEEYENLLSFNLIIDSGSLKNSFCFYQDGSIEKSLDVCIWFEKMSISSQDQGVEIELNSFLQAGKEWWKKFSEGNLDAIESKGMVSLKSESSTGFLSWIKNLFKREKSKHI